MPFVPLTPEEEKASKPPCRSPEHNPPNMMVITHPMKWVCPACGSSVMLYPREVWCEGPSEKAWTVTADGYSGWRAW